MKTYLDCGGMAAWYGAAETTGNYDDMGAFLRGLAAGFVAYAWWKDGVQWLGSCGTKLSDAIAYINDEAERIEELQKERAERTQDDGTQGG
jgi:hypothetical protein